MSFRNRLAFFLMTILIVEQLATALIAYAYLRHETVLQGRSELGAATKAFMRQLAFVSERASDGVKVLALDFPLREAIAERDRGTALSALRNHGARIGANRMMLVGLDGNVTTDTAPQARDARPFPFAGLIRAASEDGESTSLVTLDSRIELVVVISVKAPLPIAFVAAFLPVDDALLERMRAIAASHNAIALAVRQSGGGWQVVARSGATTGSEANAAGSEDTVLNGNGEEYLAASAPLTVAPGSRPVAAVLDYPLAAQLGAWRAVITPMFLMVLLALVATLIGVTFIVGRLSKPLEALAASARRIAGGDYSDPPRLTQKDELGHLSDALANMSAAIAHREQALKTALETAEHARADAERANAAKSQFLANMSHELRTPLNAIMGFGEMLEGQILGPICVGRYVQYARDIRASGAHLLSMIGRMFDLANADTHSLDLSRAPVSASALLREAVSSHLSFAKRSGVTLALEDEIGAWVEVNADAQKLKDAISNLIHNAIRFSAAGQTVSVSVRVRSNAVVMKIADNGIGIPADQLSEVVKPFHRLRAAFDARYQGAGLGLPYAKTIVEGHGGTLSLESVEGAGTCVTLLLPLYTAAVGEAA